MTSGNTKNPTPGNDVPISEKYALTVHEAAQYFGIGEKKLRQLAEGNPPPAWVLMNRTRLLVKRKVLEKDLDDSYSI